LWTDKAVYFPEKWLFARRKAFAKARLDRPRSTIGATIEVQQGGAVVGIAVGASRERCGFRLRNITAHGKLSEA
jgi:hypothetical protein